MFELSFMKLSPTENTTILVETPVPREMQPKVASILLGHLGIGGEQVGFIEKPTTFGAQSRLQMMGGEFCGNATMSLGVLLAETDHIQDEDTKAYKFEVSGCSKLVQCSVERNGNLYYGTVVMPLPETITDQRLTLNNGIISVTRVDIPGITHLIISNPDVTLEEVRDNIANWNKEICAEALGVLLTDPANATMLPTVYVPASNTIVHERGCGSGTLAYGCAMTSQQGHGGTFLVKQPGGTMSIVVDMKDGNITRAQISGNVRILARGTVYVETD